MAASLLPVSAMVLACCAPAFATDFRLGGLSWHVEGQGQGTSRLIWIEDRDDWADLPKDLPLVLLDLEQDYRPNR